MVHIVPEYGDFDFIVIGAGSTGCIIANRLSEVEEWSVLLLEAGTFPDQDLTGIPALFSLDRQSKFNWGYHTVPQEHFCLSKLILLCIQGIPRKICVTIFLSETCHIRYTMRFSELIPLA